MNNKQIINRLLFLFTLLFISVNMMAQTFIVHKVKKGENLQDIANYYRVSPSDILKYNADVHIDVKLETGQPVLIPKPETLEQVKDSIQLTGNIIDYKYHTVGENETLFSLSKKYNSNIENIVKLNNVDGYNIKLGQILIIPVYEVENAEKVIDESKYTYYEVQPKQGKWRVAYDHGITIDELERLNPEIKDENLKIGQRLIVPKFVSDPQAKKIDTGTYIYYTVLPKETMYSLSKRFNTTIEQMIDLNPELKDGLKAGQTIRFYRSVPSKSTDSELTDFDKKIEDLKKPADTVLVHPGLRQPENNPPAYNLQKINLLDSMRTDRQYRLAILLPFKLRKIDTLSDENICKKITSNKILDYYSGIAFAIDSLQQMGLNIQYDVYDTQASPYVTGKILEKTDLSDYDFVIGPVKKENIEKVAHILEFDNTPVVVHNYKGNQQFRNIVITTTENQAMQQHIINYIKEKADDKAVSLIYDPTQKAQADAIAARLGEKTIKIEGKETKKGYSISIDDISNQLAGDKENYIILISNDNSFVFSVLSTLNALRNTKRITLFTLKDMKLYEDDSNDRMNMFLANLNYHFPAKMIRLVNKQLAKNYKNRYNVLPSFTAINGFDTTFDLLVRAANADNLFEGLQKIGRTYRSSKVYLYKHSPKGGFHNEGTVILHINPSLELNKVE